MFVQLDHLKTKDLQSNLDAIQAVFEVLLFDFTHQTESSNTLTIHQQMLLNCESEPYRVCRRVNILRDYPDDKTKLYPRN